MQKEDVFIFKIKVLREDLVLLHGCKIKVIVSEEIFNEQTVFRNYEHDFRIRQHFLYVCITKIKINLRKVFLHTKLCPANRSLVKCPCK